MLQSKLFYKTLKETPKEAEAISHQLLVKAGFIDQLTAGVFSFFPLGLNVLKKIEKIIREKMAEEPVSGQELLMPALTPKENWARTGRWENFDALFKLKGAGDKDYALGATHEEVIVPLAKKVVLSYKDLPFSLFQIQTKFRNELRVKSGLLRTREFIMKDLYSFHATEEDLDKYYQIVANAYLKIYEICGIRSKSRKNKITYQTLASGGSFSKYSDEFQTITKSGEDTIYICEKCQMAINEEIKEKDMPCPNCKKKSAMLKEKAVEVGNIFKLGTKYSLPFDLKFRDKDGREKPVIMGCYGIGLGRLMGAIVEVNSDEKGIIWPESVAPFKFHLIQIENSPRVKKAAEKLYKDLQNKKIEVLYDDRKTKTAGEKLVEADLLGIPSRIVVSERTLKKRSVELKKRSEKEPKFVKINSLKFKDK